MDSLKALFTYATEGIIISNQQGLIVQANPSAEVMFGYDTVKPSKTLFRKSIEVHMRNIAIRIMPSPGHAQWVKAVIYTDFAKTVPPLQ